MSPGKAPGRVRIIGGRHRGRTIEVPPQAGVRPTPARAREALFSILGAKTLPQGTGLEGARVLDAFAGSGALGLEALSRGAALALFLEPDRGTRAVIARNIRHLGEGGGAFILPRDATKPGPVPAQGPFDAVFADAPYGSGLGCDALGALGRDGWLAPGALAVAEVGAGERIAAPPGFTLDTERTYGRTRLVFLPWR